MPDNTTLTLTLDGKTNFNTLFGARSWDVAQESGTDGWIGFLGLYDEADESTLITTTFLDGSNWDIVALRFGAAYDNKAIITDQDDGANRNIDYLKLGNNSDVDLISTRVRFIEGGDGDLHDVTLGSADTNAVELNATTNIVTTGSGWVSSISTNGNDTITIGSGGAGMVNVGGGDNTITTTSNYVSAIKILGTGTNNVDLGSAGIESLRLSNGTNTVYTGSGDVTSIFAYSGATNNITVGTGTVDQIRFSHGTHSITATEGESGEQGYIGSILVYGGETNLNLGSGGAASVRLGGGSDTVRTGSGWVGQIKTGDGDDAITIGSGGIEMLHSGSGDDVITVNGSFESIMAGYGDDSITIGNLSWNRDSFSAPSVNGGAGSDTFILGPYADTDASIVIDGGYDSAIDVVDFSSYTTDLNITLASTTQWQNTGAGWVMLLGIDSFIGGRGNDLLTGASFGSKMNSVIYGNAGNDTLYGGAGDDKLYGGSGNDILDDGIGTDYVDGGAGIDTFQRNLSEDYNDYAFTTVVDLSAGKFYAVGYENDFDTLVSIENVNMTGNFHDRIYGTGGSNTLKGNNGNDVLSGKNGKDKLYGGAGKDTLEGGKGKDTLQGDAGKDTMFGGSSADTFVFTKTSDSKVKASKADVIKDFEQGKDHIDLSAIDASTKLDGNNKFTFDGTTSFGTSNEGDIYYETFNNSGTANDYTMVYIDTDNDRGTEMSIKLMGLHNLTADDFIL